MTFSVSPAARNILKNSLSRNALPWAHKYFKNFTKSKSSPGGGEFIIFFVKVDILAN